MGLNADGKYWRVAEYSHETLIYYIVIGLISVYDDSTTAKLIGYDSDLGSIIRFDLDSNEYKIVGVPDVIFDDMPDNPVPQNVLKGLANNYIQSLMLNFGGKSEFKAELKKQSIDVNFLPTLIKDAMNSQNILQ
jgi:hypothetical protein